MVNILLDEPPYRFVRQGLAAYRQGLHNLGIVEQPSVVVEVRMRDGLGKQAGEWRAWFYRDRVSGIVVKGMISSGAAVGVWPPSVSFSTASFT